MPFDRGAYWAGYTFRSVARMHGRLNPLWTFTVRGDFPENPRLPYVSGVKSRELCRHACNFADPH